MLWYEFNWVGWNKQQIISLGTWMRSDLFVVECQFTIDNLTVVRFLVVNIVSFIVICDWL